MGPVTVDDVQPLLEQFDGEGQVLSCYASLSGADGFRPFWQAEFDAQADVLRKAVGHAEPGHAELERNLADAKEALQLAPPDARWLAVFCANQRGFRRTIALDVPVRTELVVDKAPYLAPLLTAICRRREYLVVHADTHQGRIYAATPGSLGLVDEITWDVPKKQHSAGERWGQGQATIARHREDAIAHFQKELVRSIEKAWDHKSYSGLIFLGPQPVVAEFVHGLPRRLAARLVHTLPEPLDERPSGIASTIHDVVLKTFAEDETKAVERLWDRLAKRRAVVTGAADALVAVQSGRIGPDGHGFLVLGPDPRETVGRCTRCRTLAADVPPMCPRCQAPCVAANLWEEVLLLALRHRITVHFVDDPHRLAAYGGIVAAYPKAAARELARGPVETELSTATE